MTIGSTRPTDRRPVSEAAAAVSPSGQHSGPTSGGDLAIVGVLGVAQVLFLAILASRGYFSQDDLHNFGVVRSTGLSWKFLNQDLIGGHWAPASHLLIWFVNSTSTLNWGLAVVIMLPFATVSLVLLDRILRAVDTPQYLRYGFLVVLALSPILVEPGTWFASGIQALPGLAFMLLSIDGFLRYRSTRQTRYWLECVTGFVVGLLFWEPSLFLIAALPLLALVLSPSRLSVRDAARSLRDLWSIWLALLAVGVIYLWNYEANVEKIPVFHPSGRTWLRFVWAAWAKALGPATFGIALRGHPILGQTVTIIVTQSLIAAAVIFTVWRDRRAWRAWVFLAAVFGMNAALLGWERGASLAYAGELRYQACVLPVLILAVALATHPRTVDAAPRRSGASSTAHEVRRERRAFSMTSAVKVGIGLAFVCIYALLATRSGVWLADHSPALDPGAFNPGVEAPKYYLAHTRADLARLGKRERVVSLFDEPLPLLVSNYFPYGLASRLIPQVSTHVSFDGANEPRYVIDPTNGHIHPAQFRAQNVATQRPGGSPAASSAPACVTAGRIPATLSTTMTPALTPGWWTGRLELLAGPTIHLRLMVDNGHQTYEIADPPGWPDGHTGYVTIPRRTQSFTFSFLGVGHIRRLHIVVAPGQSVCLTRVGFGTAIAR